MHNDSSRNSDEAGHDPPGPGLRVRPPAQPTAAQAAGHDAARETGVITKPSQGRGSVGLTERLAAASARRARRVLVIWGIVFTMWLRGVKYPNPAAVSDSRGGSSAYAPA